MDVAIGGDGGMWHNVIPGAGDVRVLVVSQRRYRDTIGFPQRRHGSDLAASKTDRGISVGGCKCRDPDHEGGTPARCGEHGTAPMIADSGRNSNHIIKDMRI